MGFIDFTASSFACSGNKYKNFIIGAYNFPWEDCQFLKWLDYPNMGELRSTGQAIGGGERVTWGTEGNETKARNQGQLSQTLDLIDLVESDLALLVMNGLEPWP